jgi:hypothetical protein
MFPPQSPVDMAEGQRVSLSIEPTQVTVDNLNDVVDLLDLNDVVDLLDTEFIESCRDRAAPAPSLEEVRRALSGFDGSLADRICEERDER